MTPPQQDHYTLIGVPETASEEDITRAYRRKAMEHHPDRNPHRLEESEAMMKRINQAYEVLGSPEKRARYDDACRRKSEPAPTTQQTTEKTASRPTESTQKTRQTNEPAEHATRAQQTHAPAEERPSNGAEHRERPNPKKQRADSGKRPKPETGSGAGTKAKTATRAKAKTPKVQGIGAEWTTILVAWIVWRMETLDMLPHDAAFITALPYFIVGFVLIPRVFYLLFAKKRGFPRYFILLMVVGIVSDEWLVLMTLFQANAPIRWDAFVSFRIVSQVAGAVVLSAYLMASERVRDTFVK